MADQDVLIRVGSQTEAAVSGIANMSANIASSISGIGAQFDRVATQLLSNANSITRVFEDTVGAFASVDQSMANVRSIVSGTNEEFDQMRALAVDIASELPTSTSKVADGFFQLASAGLDANEIMAATPAIMDLSVAAATDFETAANGVTAAMFTYGLGVEDANRITDIFQNTNVNFKTTMPELAESLKFAGSTAAQMGISLETTAASIGLLRNQGLAASQAGTALRSTFVGIFNDSDKAKNAMNRLNFEIIKTSDGSLDLSATFATLQAGLLSVGDKTEETSLLMDIFGKLGVSGAQVLASNSAELDTLAEKMTTAGAVSAAVTIQMEGMGNKMEILNGTIEDQQAALGEKLAPAQLIILENKLRMLELLNKLPDGFIKWGGGILFVAAGFAKMIIPLVQSIVQMIVLITTLRAHSAARAQSVVATGAHTAATSTYTIAQMAANLAALLFPAFLLIAGLLALAIAIVFVIQHWDDIRDVMTSLWEFISGTFVAAWQGLIAIFGNVRTMIEENTNTFLLLLSILVPFIGLPLLIISNWETVTEFMGAFWEGLIFLFRESIFAIVGAFAEGFALIFFGINDLFGLIGTAIGDFVGDAVQWGADLVGNLITGIVGAIPGVGAAVGGIGSIVSKGLGFLSPTNPKMQGLGKGMGAEVGVGLKESATNLRSAAATAVAGIGGAVPTGGAAGGARGAFGAGAGITIGTINLAPGETADQAQRFTDEITELLARTSTRNVRG